MEIEEAVIEKIRNRRAAGRKKYGTTMERTDLTKLQWLDHAQEELMDGTIYLERLKRELSEPAAPSMDWIDGAPSEPGFYECIDKRNGACRQGLLPMYRAHFYSRCGTTLTMDGILRHRRLTVVEPSEPEEVSKPEPVKPQMPEWLRPAHDYFMGAVFSSMTMQFAQRTFLEGCEATYDLSEPPKPEAFSVVRGAESGWAMHETPSVFLAFHENGSIKSFRKSDGWRREQPQ